MAKPEIYPNLSQLRFSFKNHFKIYSSNQSDASCRLLLFYAVECGLKARFLLAKNEDSTKCFIHYFGVNQKYGYGHNLPRWVAELRIPASVFANYSENPNDPIENVHEKLRYGVNLASSDSINYLISLATFLKKNQI